MCEVQFPKNRYLIQSNTKIFLLYIDLNSDINIDNIETNLTKTHIYLVFLSNLETSSSSKHPGY